MLTATRSRTALLALTGASFVGLLAGCSSTSGNSAGADSGGSAGSSSSAAAGSSSTPASSSATDAGSSGSGSYKNGTYTEQGSYSSPGGTETISVALTIADDAVKAVTVKTVKADPTATQYQSQFIGGISDAIVGKKIDALNVTQVAGSSLTSQGFDSALTKIKADAKDD